MDEPEPTQNFFIPHEIPHEDQTALIGQAGPLPGGEPPGEYYPQPTQVQYAPPPEWPVPVWRRRGALIGAAVVVLAIVGLVVGIVIASPSSTPATTNTAAVAPATSAPAAAKGKSDRAGGRVKLLPGESLVLGTVSSVTNGQLVVTPTKGGDPVTVTTSSATRFAGGASSVTDLKPGERVQLIVKDGAAVAIRARKAAPGN